MAISQRDTQLWKAAQKSLADFGQIFDPNNTNPARTNTEYKRYKSIKNLSDLDSITTSGGGGRSSINPITVAGDMGKSLIGAFEGDQGFPDQAKKLSTIWKDVFDLIDSLKNPLSITKALTAGVGLVANEIVTYYQQQSALLDVINKKAGLTGDFSVMIREELTRANPELELIGISFDELSTSAKSVVDDSGRFLALNRTTWKETGLAASAYVGTLSDLVGMFPQFAKVGVGAGDVAKQIETVGKRSIELGLQSQKTTRELSTNLSKLNEYGFKNGIQGLAEMVRRSTELRMNMDTIFQVADKVFDPEGAIDLAANLQAIGGAIGDFNDPLKLMYMATNNVEGLGEAFEGVAASLATYNQEQGRFEITGVNIRRARALAKELGISYSELANTAVASAERTSAAADLMSRGLDLDEDQKRFITNIATMKDGKMQIELQSDKLQSIFRAENIPLEELTQTQVDQLIALQDDFKKLDTEDIVRQQATDVQNINRGMTFLVAVARQRAIETGSKAVVDSINKFLGGGYDLRNLGEDISKKVREAGDSIKFKPEGINKPTKTESKIESKTNLDESKMRGSVKQQTTEVAATTTVNHNHTYTIKSDSTVVDGVTRAIINSPSLSNDLSETLIPNEGEYTSSIMRA